MTRVHDCPFCGISHGETEADIVWKNDDLLAFKSLGRRTGRLLVVPTQHYESIGDVPSADLGRWIHRIPVLAAHLKVPGYKIQINSGGAFSRVRHLHFHFIYGEKQ